MEVWKDIPRYEGIYQASSYGRIRSCEGKATFSSIHGKRVWKQRIIKPKACADYNKTGYRVTLWKDKKPKDFLVARLVCTTFHEDLINTKMTVNHKDGNRLNNNIENLEWLSLSDNIKDGFRTGLYSSIQKKVSLTSEDGNTITFNSMSEASCFLKRNKGYISDCLKKEMFAKSKDGTKYKISIIKK